MALLLAALVQIMLGDLTGFVTLSAALPATLLAVVMLRQERPNVIVLVSLVAVIALAAEIYTALDGQTRYVAGIGGEVVVFGLGILAVFVARERPVAVAGGFLTASAAIVVVAQVHLNGFTFEIVSDIVVIAAVLGTLMYLVIRVMESLSLSRSRYSDLAEVIPVAVLELDVSMVAGRVAEYAALDRADRPALESSYSEVLTEMMRHVRLSYSNETADKLVESLGTWDEVVVGENASVLRAEANRMLVLMSAGTVAGAGEVALCRRDGSDIDFIYRWAIGHVRGQQDPGRLVIAATDVTRLRQAEHALEDQLRERDQFVASVSHELRTPLTSIMGLTEELVARPGDFDEAERSELLGIVAAETRDVVDIVEDLLVTAQAEAGKLTVTVAPCDFGAEAGRLATLLGGVQTSLHDVWVLADPVRLRQVLRNLLSNAARHGGSDVRLLLSRAADRAYLEVRDNGDALSADERERIFLPYERSNDGDAVGSVGLGLHVARLLAQLMDGDLTYDHDGSDTVFRLDLPLTTGPADSDGDQREQAEGSAA